MSTEHPTQRQHRMAVLARADFAELNQRWQQLNLQPEYTFIREPEVGLAQVRARMGGTGNAFNMGDVTITRAVVRMADGELGYSYIRGRNKAHAELAAVLDGLLQQGDTSLDISLIEPLHTLYLEQQAQRQREVAASKVDFFTMVRGED